MLKSLSLENYKGFYDAQTIGFAFPDGQKAGSGLTLIVGPNNTGKTTIIESLLINKDKKFKETERHTALSPRVKIENTSGGKTEYTNIGDGSVIEVTGEAHGIKFDLVPSRRFWSYQFQGEWTFSNLRTHSIASDIRNAGSLDLGPILKKILKEPTLKDRFDNYIKKIIPHFSEWTIDTNDANNDYIKYRTTTTFHQANLLGDGIISLFRIISHLLSDEESTFIIDEPELSLHPTAQKRLSHVLSELARSKQIILCTHSPYFVNWSDFAHGAKFIRLNKHGDARCTVSALDNSKDYGNFIASNMTAYQRPQLLDIVSKEILFADKILFTEGQEDVGLIRKWATENNKDFPFEIFGYGVGGETNMKLFLEMAKDLDLKKVGGLYDANATTFSNNQSAYPDYFFRQLPTEDIRDKVNQCIPTCPNRTDRVGIFTSTGELKPEYETQFESIMNEFNSFFDN